MKTTDVAVVGAGPAGIAAALAAAEAGVQTTLIDEQPQVGGHLRWSIETETDLPGAFADLNRLPGVRLAESLTSRLAESKVEVVTNGTAWGWFDDNVLGVVANGESYELDARSIVVASGSTDIMHPFVGSTLPGVMTARAALIFLHLHRVLPGRRFAVIGAGNEADEVAHAVEAAGAEVVSRVEHVAGVRVTGDGQVERIHVGDETSVIDVVVVALGRQPDAELALQSLAVNVFSAGAGGIVPRRSPSCETSTAGLFVAGDAAGIVTVAEALAEGRLAGLQAAGAEESLLTTASDALRSLRTAERASIVEQLRLEAVVR